jgi:hypothetical protein
MHVAVLSLAVLCFSCSFIYAGDIAKESPSSQKGMHLLSTFEGGKLYSAGKFRVLELSGTYRQMGRQYGRLMSGPMTEMYHEVLSQYAKNKIACSDIGLEDFAMELFRLYPKRFQELAEGMSETSAMGLNKIAVLNEFFDYFLRCRAGSGANGYCSQISVWSRYSKDGKVVMGRNFDFPSFYRAFNKYITIVAYNPSEASNSAAVITYPGQIGSIQAFNSRGLILENNNGVASGDSGRYFGKRIPFLIKDLGAMLDSSTVEGLDAALVTSRMHYPLIYNIAYPDGAFNYEMTTYDVKRRQGQDGLLIGTNHFISPGWSPPPSEYLEGIKDSKERYDNLRVLAERNMGKIDASLMMAIMDVSRDKGGATPQDSNIYQFVAVPMDLKIWVKALTYDDWTEVDLKPLLRQ